MTVPLIGFADHGYPQSLMDGHKEILEF
jgi:hypothetical protein